MKRFVLCVFALIACHFSRPQFSSLVDAVRSGDVPTTKMMLARGADANAPVGGNGWTPLLHAVHKHQLKTALVLLEQAHADPNRGGPDGITPLMMAAGYGQRDMVELLLSHGARTSLRDRGGDLALDYALSGVTDIDGFTFFSCQDDTAALLGSVSPRPSTGSMRWARIKGCRFVTNRTILR